MDFKYIKRAFKEPEQSYFLFGPRGTGKSTMTVKNNPDALLIDLRLADVRYRLSANPDHLTELVSAQPDGATIIIDEIQKIPELLSIVHMLIEKKRKWRFILTGSSARKLKRQGVDLLGGRALRKVLHPFMASELKQHFNLEQALSYGLLPLRFAHEDALETLQAYISLYLEEEVKMEGLIRHYESFTRFLHIMSLSHGSILNITNIARECHVKRTTVSDWISILEDLLICYQINVFTQRAKRELSAHPKFYLFDVGVYRALRPRSIKDSESEVNGAGLEGLVLQHLMAWKDYTSEKHEISFWRTRSGLEVDFVVFGALGFWAIEVKNAEKIRSEDLKSLVEFQEDYPEAKVILLYRGKERLLKNNVLCLPCEDFLKIICPNAPLSS
ncbi:ATP-binding protein [Candidatus Dependentiae bacterium]|jgi:predicted AAA+ superfamily ATPase|nr:ATP-binding protein [Candidatus Dependentiae bacterium]